MTTFITESSSFVTNLYRLCFNYKSNIITNLFTRFRTWKLKFLKNTMPKA